MTINGIVKGVKIIATVLSAGGAIVSTVIAPDKMSTKIRRPNFDIKLPKRK